MSKFTKEFEVEDSISVHSSNKDDKRTGSSFGAFFNIVCVIAGTGTLGLPLAVKHGGWVAIIIFVLTAMIAIYAARLLIECLYYNPEKRMEEFPDIGEAAFGLFGRYFVKVFSYSISLSTPCIYILLTGQNIHAIIFQITNGGEVLSQTLWILIAGIIILIPSASLKSLKEVAILAAFGALTTLVVVFCVVIIGGIQYADPDYIRPETSLVNWSGIPLALATIAFSYGGNVVYPHVESTMKHPKSWNKVVFSAIGTTTLMYIVIGITGYLYYGDDVQSPILASLPPGAGSLLAYIMITFHVILAAPIYICSFSLEQERMLKIDRKYMSASKEFTCRVILRSIVTATLTVVAIFLPFFPDLMSLVGSISNCLIVFLVPIVCHYKLFGIRGRPIWEYVLTALVIIIGISGLVLGTKDSLITLIDHIIHGAPAVAKH